MNQEKTATVNEWKDQLSAHLEKYIGVITAFNEMIPDVRTFLSEQMVNDLARYDAKSNLQDALASWVAVVVDQANLDSDNISGSRFTIDRLPSGLIHFDTGFNGDNDKFLWWSKLSATEMAHYITQHYDYLGLYDAIKHEMSGFGQIALADSATYLHGELFDLDENLLGFEIGNFKALRLRSYNELISHLFTFENYFKVTGFVEAVKSVYDAEYNSDSVSVESGMVVGSDLPVTATFFKNKLEFSIHPEMNGKLQDFIVKFSRVNVA